MATSNLQELQLMNLSSQYLNSYLSLSILGIAESEIPLDIENIMVQLRNDLIRVDPAFSSIVVRKNGRQYWKMVEVKFENHIFTPTFPKDLSRESYSQHFDQYLSKIGLEKLPETQPLWELHVINYPTRTAEGTMIFKMHHALGDGFSIMGAIFSVMKRADNSSLPLTFPSAHPSETHEVERMNRWRSRLNLVSRSINTVYDIVNAMMHATLFVDNTNSVRSGITSVESQPKHTTRITFSLDDIRRVKSNLGVTVNDIVVGVIFYGVHLYTKIMDQSPKNIRKTALIVMNTRMLLGYRSVDEMLKKKLFGNQFSFIHLPLPSYSDEEKVDLKKVIFQVKEIINRNRKSMAVHLNGLLISLMYRLRGAEAVSKYMYSVLKCTSFSISNLVGPIEKMAIADHPISSIYFTVGGVPQSLIFPVMSYNGKLTIVISAEKDFIDSQLLSSCMNIAFKKIVENA